DDLVRIALENLTLGTRDVVFRKLADRFEQCRPEVVIEVLGRQTLRLARQSRADVSGERSGSAGPGILEQCDSIRSDNRHKNGIPSPRPAYTPRNAVLHPSDAAEGL